MFVCIYLYTLENREYISGKNTCSNVTCHQLLTTSEDYYLKRKTVAEIARLAG